MHTHIYIHIQEDAMLRLIHEYCRESGVRNLSKQIHKVCRKVALKLVKEQQKQQQQQDNNSEPLKAKILDDNATTTSTTDTTKEASVITPPTKRKRGRPRKIKTADKIEEKTTINNDNNNDNINENNGTTVALQYTPKEPMIINAETLEKYVGPPLYESDRLHEITPVGVALGLAVSDYGGSSTYVETTRTGKVSTGSLSKLHATGQLGSVMKESTDLAYSVSKSFLFSLQPENKFFNEYDLHLHCPAGGIPKEGPSAGIVMVTSLLSLALNKPVTPNLAMTGELTLSGLVLPIGGVKEKMIVARRLGVKVLVLPKENKRNVDELDKVITEGIEVMYVSTYKDVYEVAFAASKATTASNNNNNNNNNNNDQTVQKTN